MVTGDRGDMGYCRQFLLYTENSEQCKRQEDLNKLYQWSTTWQTGFKFYATNCKVVPLETQKVNTLCMFWN